MSAEIAAIPPRQEEVGDPFGWGSDGEAQRADGADRRGEAARERGRV